MDWDARFRSASVVEPGPPGLLAGREELVPTSGRALDVACGRGTVAVWLTGRGLVVDAVDASPAGLARGRELADRLGVTVGWIEADLDDGLPAARSEAELPRRRRDTVTGPYDVVVCQRFRDPALYPALIAALAPGGLLAITVLSDVGDAGGPFRAAPGELLTAFGHLAVLDHSEGGGEAGLLARRAGGAAG